MAAGALLVAGAGLLAAYLRLRREFDRPVALLAIALLSGATPLLNAVVRPSLSTVALFSCLAAVAYFSTGHVARPAVRAMALIGAALAVPLVAPDAAARPTLFSPSNGFLALTPIVYVAVVGAIFRSTRHVEDSAAILVALILWPLTQTSLVPALALMAPGLAAALAWARRRPLAAVAPLVLLAIAWNYWLMVQYTVGTIPKDAPVRFADMVRQQADVHTRQPFVHMFAFPGNAVAAWREGVPLSRYDQLSGEPLRQRFEIQIDRNADRFLLDGWGPLGSSATGTFRVVDGGPAILLVPLRPGNEAIDISIVGAARGDSAGASVSTNVEVNGHLLGEVHLSSVPAEARLRVNGPDVGRVFRAGYNRLSIVTSGSAPLAIFRIRLGPAA